MKREKEEEDKKKREEKERLKREREEEERKKREEIERKKDFLTIAFSSFMIYNRRWGETVGKRKTKKRAYPGVSVLFAIQ